MRFVALWTCISFLLLGKTTLARLGEEKKLTIEALEEDAVEEYHGHDVHQGQNNLDHLQEDLEDDLEMDGDESLDVPVGEHPLDHRFLKAFTAVQSLLLSGYPEYSASFGGYFLNQWQKHLSKIL